MTTKTFYSVKFTAWGADRTSVAWFNDREEAYKFADHDYRDNPVAHCVRNAETIRDLEKRVFMSR